MLVFWLDTIAGKMAFLIAIEIYDLIGIMLLFFLSNVNGVIANGRGFFWFSNTFLPAFKLFLLIFFFSRLRYIVMYKG